MLCDEGEVYGCKFDVVGVEVMIMCYDGMIYDFGLLNVLVDDVLMKVVMKVMVNEIVMWLK